MSIKFLLDKIRLDQENENVIDWDDFKNKYLKSVESLYGEVGKWLDLKNNNKLITSRIEVKEIIEEDVGKYQANILFLKFSSTKTICLNPIGCRVSNGEGIVELYLLGDIRKKFHLNLIENKNKASWVVSRYRLDFMNTNEFYELNEKSFATTLGKLLGYE